MVAHLCPGSRRLGGHRHRVAPPSSLRLDQVGQQQIFLGRIPVLRCVGVPLLQGLLPFRCGEQVERREGPVRILRHTLHEALEVPGDSANGDGVEELGAKAPGTHQTSVLGNEGNGEIEFRRAVVDLQRLPFEPRQVQPGGRTLQREHDLEERGTAESALRRQLLHQTLVGQLLVGIGAESGFANPIQELPERRLPPEICPQRQGIDEESDQTLRFRTSPPRDRRADGEVHLAGEATEKRLENRQEGHERCGSPAPAHGFQATQQRRLQRFSQNGATVAGLGRMRAVRRQLETAGQVRQVPAPVVEQPLQAFARELLPLPPGEIGVLPFQRRQGRLQGQPAMGRGVEHAELPQKDLHRPAVGDDVVHQQQRGVLLRPRAHQDQAQEGPMLEVEGLAGRLGQQLASDRLAASRRQTGEIDQSRPGIYIRRRNDRPDSVLVALERRAQHLVAAHDLADAEGQVAEIERPADPGGEDLVVGGALGLQLVHQPEALLGEREGDPLLGSLRSRRGRWIDGRNRSGCRQAAGEPGHGGAGQQSVEGQALPQLSPDAGLELGGHQRVAAELEEIVVTLDPRDPEGLLPEPGEPFFELRPREAAPEDRGGRTRIRRWRLGRDLAATRHRLGILDPISLPFEGIGRQGHSPPLVCHEEPLPRDVPTGNPGTAERLQELDSRGARGSREPREQDIRALASSTLGTGVEQVPRAQAPGQLQGAPTDHRTALAERPTTGSEGPGDVGERNRRGAGPLQVLGQAIDRTFEGSRGPRGEHQELLRRPVRCGGSR